MRTVIISAALCLAASIASAVVGQYNHRNHPGGAYGGTPRHDAYGNVLYTPSDMASIYGTELRKQDGPYRQPNQPGAGDPEWRFHDPQAFGAADTPHSWMKHNVPGYSN